MPIIESKNKLISSLKGIHLWHGELSSCSQRVRMTLSEKDLNWHSHLISIPKNEHATPEYQSINPRGLVPSLLDNGTLLIESCDIIDYLDVEYPDPPLRPTNPDNEVRMLYWLNLADTAQADLKLLSHEFLFRERKEMTSDELNSFSENHKNQDLVNFVKEWKSSPVFPRKKLDDAVNRTHKNFCQINDALAENVWLIGDKFSLADIAWTPNVHRMMLMQWPLSRYTNLCKWFDRIKLLPCYKYGILEWEPTGQQDRFVEYTAKRRKKTGIHVTAYGVLSQK